MSATTALVSVNDDDILDALAAELEAYRREVQIDLLSICKAMHNIQVMLKEDGMIILTTDEWEKNLASKHLADAAASLICCVESLRFKPGKTDYDERKHRFVRRPEPEDTYQPPEPVQKLRHAV